MPGLLAPARSSPSPRPWKAVALSAQRTYMPLEQNLRPQSPGSLPVRPGAAGMDPSPQIRCRSRPPRRTAGSRPAGAAPRPRWRGWRLRPPAPSPRRPRRRRARLRVTASSSSCSRRAIAAIESSSVVRSRMTFCAASGSFQRSGVLGRPRSARRDGVVRYPSQKMPPQQPLWTAWRSRPAARFRRAWRAVIRSMAGWKTAAGPVGRRMCRYKDSGACVNPRRGARERGRREARSREPQYSPPVPSPIDCSASWGDELAVRIRAVADDGVAVGRRPVPGLKASRMTLPSPGPGAQAGAGVDGDQLDAGRHAEGGGRLVGQRHRHEVAEDRRRVAAAGDAACPAAWAGRSRCRRPPPGPARSRRTRRPSPRSSCRSCPRGACRRTGARVAVPRSTTPSIIEVIW